MRDKLKMCPHKVGRKCGGVRVPRHNDARVTVWGEEPSQADGHQLFNLTDFVNIAFCSRKAYVGEGLVPSRTGFTGDHKGRPYVSSHHVM